MLTNSLMSFTVYIDSISVKKKRLLKAINYHILLPQNKMAFGLFGDSYIKRLHKFSQGNLHVPGSSTFVYQGGLKFSRIDAVDTLKKGLKAARARIVFLSIGGNDISPISDPDTIYANICSLVKEFEDVGVWRVYISEILPRADLQKRPAWPYEG